MRSRRSLKRSAVVLLAGVLLVYLAGRWFMRSAYAADQVAARLGALAGAPVRLAGLDLGFHGSSLSGLEVHEANASNSPPWLTIGSIDADLSLAQLISGNVGSGVVTLRDVHVTLRFDRDGRLLTRLPQPTTEEGGPLPTIRLVHGAFTMQREGRPDETIHNIQLEAREDGSLLVLSGTIDDPDWGPWNVAGSRGSPSTPFAFNMKTREIVHVTPDLLRRTPFVPATVWNHVTCDGDTPCEVAVQFNAQPMPPLNYRVALEPRNTRVFVRDIDLRADRAQGKVTIADDVLTLENVHGQSAGGTLKLGSVMDFRSAANVLRFSIEAGLLSLGQLPANWGVPAIRGNLSGKADLEVICRTTGTTVKGQGEGSVHVFPLPPLKLRLVADGGGIRFQLARN